MNVHFVINPIQNFDGLIGWEGGCQIRPSRWMVMKPTGNKLRMVAKSEHLSRAQPT